MQLTRQGEDTTPSRQRRAFAHSRALLADPEKDPIWDTGVLRWGVLRLPPICFVFLRPCTPEFDFVG